VEKKVEATSKKEEKTEAAPAEKTLSLLAEVHSSSMSPIEEYEMEESREALLQTDEENSENPD